MTPVDAPGDTGVATRSATGNPGFLDRLHGHSRATAGIAFALVLRYGLDLLLETPYAYIVMALGMSLVVGLASGVLPAEKAAALAPIDAARAE